MTDARCIVVGCDAEAEVFIVWIDDYRLGFVCREHGAVLGHRHREMNVEWVQAQRDLTEGWRVGQDPLNPFASVLVPPEPV